MTVAQLERAVARLGFAPSLEGAEALLHDAAERALDEIAAVRPRVARATLFHYPVLPLYFESDLRPFVGTKEIHLQSGNVYFARLIGTGSLSIRRGGQVLGRQFISKDDGQPAVLEGELPSGSGDITLRLAVSKECRLIAFAVYDLPLGMKAPDPTAPTAYDLRELFPDFGALLAPPKDTSGRPLPEGGDHGYTLSEGHILSLPRNMAGQVELTYRKRIDLPDEGEIPISDDEAALLPLCCAAYVLLDGDREKAEFYLARFREGLRRLDREGKGAVPYPDSTHWG